MKISALALKKEIVEVGRRVYARGYVASNDGNISARLDQHRILITPSGVSKGFMSINDIITVDIDGRVLAGVKNPSSELPMHLAIYHERPDVRGICHAHPVHATGFAVAGLPLDQAILPEVIVLLGSIPLAEYGTPGGDEFFQPLLKWLPDYDAFLLANHGALTLGNSVFNAYYKMETLEHFAHIAFVARQLGGARVLGNREVEKLMALRQRFGITTKAGCRTREAEPGRDQG